MRIANEAVTFYKSKIGQASPLNDEINIEPEPDRHTFLAAQGDSDVPSTSKSSSGTW